MYNFVLFLHSWVRWLFIIALGALVVRSYLGWRRGLPWQPQDRRLLSWVLALADVQLLLGLALFVALSHHTRSFFAQGPAALDDPQTAYWVTEHAIPMIGAVFLAHVGHVLVRRGENPHARYRRAALFFTLVALIVLFSTPWPFQPYGRPWFRLSLR